MVRKDQQVYWVNPMHMAQIAGRGTHDGAKAAWDRVRDIEKAGHTAAVFYSAFNGGFIVLDENNPEQMKRSTALSMRAKPFPI